MKEMTIYINNEALKPERALTLSELLHERNLLNARGIAVAVNNAVIPKASWPVKQLADKDKITIIKATQGG